MLKNLSDNKKIFYPLTILIVVITLFLIGRSFAKKPAIFTVGGGSNANLSLNPSLKNLKLGEKDKINIVLDSHNKEVTGFTIALSYDHTGLEVNSISISPPFYGLVNYNNGTDGKILLSAILPANASSPVLSGPFNIASFEVKGLTKLDAKEPNIVFLNNDPKVQITGLNSQYSLTAVDGRLCVDSKTTECGWIEPTPTPTLTPIPTPTPTITPTPLPTSTPTLTPTPTINWETQSFVGSLPPGKFYMRYGSTDVGSNPGHPTINFNATRRGMNDTSVQTAYNSFPSTPNFGGTNDICFADFNNLSGEIPYARKLHEMAVKTVGNLNKTFSFDDAYNYSGKANLNEYLTALVGPNGKIGITQYSRHDCPSYSNWVKYIHFYASQKTIGYQGYIDSFRSKRSCGSGDVQMIASLYPRAAVGLYSWQTASGGYWLTRVEEINYSCQLAKAAKFLLDSGEAVGIEVYDNSPLDRKGYETVTTRKDKAGQIVETSDQFRARASAKLGVNIDENFTQLINLDKDIANLNADILATGNSSLCP